MSLSKIVESFADKIDEQLDKAYHILGAKPGPGVDIMIYPTYPICGKWMTMGATQAGSAFINKFWPVQPIPSNTHLDRFKRQAESWGLKYKIEYQTMSLT